MNINFLDCTLRDGGYYNSWDFSDELIASYVNAMKHAGVNSIELGFRSIDSSGFKGACAYTTDRFASSLDIPASIDVGVMVNASDLFKGGTLEEQLQALFPESASNTRVTLVRVACHVHEFQKSLPAAEWLKKKGYKVGYNLMQVADRTENEIKDLSVMANGFPLDVLYFADSMGSMSPQQARQIIEWLRSGWKGELGIHTHDNLGLGLTNTLTALDAGVTWVDSTVTGMGRGPGNTRTEELAIEIAERRGGSVNMVPLSGLLKEHFNPMKDKYRWGTNPFYYLSGKYGIHPSYIQEMQSDSRYTDEDIFSIIDRLKESGGKKFTFDELKNARKFYRGEPQGSWSPDTVFSGKDVLIVGAGPGTRKYRHAIEDFIAKNAPIVVGLNTLSDISEDLIDYRISCHPARIMADQVFYKKMKCPLIIPHSMLPPDLKELLEPGKCLDYGIGLDQSEFAFRETHGFIPKPLVAAYALAAVTSGKARQIYLAGFDGYGTDDPRTEEMKEIFKGYTGAPGNVPLTSITPNRYGLPTRSVYL